VTTTAARTIRRVQLVVRLLFDIGRCRGDATRSERRQRLYGRLRRLFGGGRRGCGHDVMVFGRRGHHDGLEQRRVGSSRRGRRSDAHGRRFGGDGDAGRGVVQQRNFERGIAQGRYRVGLGLGGARMQPVRGQGPAQQGRTRFRCFARSAERRAGGFLATTGGGGGGGGGGSAGRYARGRSSGRTGRARRGVWIGQQGRRAVRLRGVGATRLMAGRERQRARRPSGRLR